ncbi:adipose-secreted signaling protein isoform X2 [Brevipalpus obovatus]|uniref:adipose-secreted signaling protein isoform X2 n=1 Tax=Brevipalpus obovatus TaxID=246614 RepID=UPI003D9F1E9F
MEEDKNEKHKVHFEGEDTFDHDSKIVIKECGNEFNVHLGFLQVDHWYHVYFEFSVSKSSQEFPLTENESSANVNLLELSTERIDNDYLYKLKLEFFASKEKLVRERLILKSPEKLSSQIALILNARVLGKGKGTPLLRSGIHCVGVKESKEEDDSDLSDWQGFN